MSQQDYEPSMEGRSQGSVKRARERALAGELPPRRPPKNDVQRGDSPLGDLSPPPRRHMPTGSLSDDNSTFYWADSATRPLQPSRQASPRQAKPRMPAGADLKGGAVISRPTQAPHWPLPPNSPLRVQNTDNRPLGPGQHRQPPPRPQRPSRIPSMVDQSRPQEPTPVFLNPHYYQPEERDSYLSQNLSTPGTNASSRLTSSSVGTIPDFPVPTANSTNNSHISSVAAPPISSTLRKTTNLGPPPTTRRGASSYYSITSNVSPIPEESLRTPGSYASSFAMPNNWNISSAASSPKYPDDVYYDDSPTTRSRDSYDSGEEIKLVRSASIGKKGKASLVDTRPLNVQSRPTRPSPNPLAGNLSSGTGYVDASTSSSEQTLPHKYKGSTSSTMNEPNPAASSSPPPMPESTRAELPSSRIPTNAPSPSPAPASTARRPPKLDIDAVRKAEARGSLTSLPDLIKRATRLVAIMDTGKRPASRFDNLSDFLEKSDTNDVQDRHQSGLSEMLNAFPPPASRNGRRSRGSWFRTTSWPLAPHRQGEGSDPNRKEGQFQPSSEDGAPQRHRKCCGLPPWAFILLVILLLCMIAVAIVIPLQFFVFKTLGNHDEPASALEQCRSDLICQNGGTNVISQGSCSCICTNGFGGSDCSESGSAACTTTNLASSDSDSGIEDVTIGRALPRLIADASSNFSVPLSGTVILAKINSGDISCLRQNALVSFSGRSTRVGEADLEVTDMSDDSLDLSDEAVIVDTDAVPTISGDDLDGASPTQALDRVKRWTTITATEDLSGPEPTAVGNDEPTDRTSSSAFNVTEEALDFARVAVLYVLQEQSITEASSAQTELERFFNHASKTNPQLDILTEEDAMNVTVGGSSSVDMVNYRIDLGEGIIGGGSTS